MQTTAHTHPSFESITQAKWLQDISPVAKKIICDHGSLTKQLQQHFAHTLQHQLLSCVKEKPSSDETTWLDNKQEDIYIRTIAFKAHASTIVLARTLIPTQSAQHPHLDPRQPNSIGRTLFNDAKLQRSDFSFALLAHTQSELSLWPHKFDKTSHIIVRRSRFVYQDLPLIITELFLPEFFHAINSTQS